MKQKTLYLLVALVSVALLLSAFTVAGAKKEKKEDYYWIASLSTLPLFLAHDYPALKEEAERLGVDIHFLGPSSIDIARQNTILQQVLAKDPAGILFMPFGSGHNAVINEAIDQGVPLVTVDGDAPQSDRLGYSGTNWVQLGRKQAEVMANLLGGEGQVMLSAIIPNDNTRKARNGIREVLDEYENIEIVGLLNDQGQVSTAARKSAQAIQSNPNIDGFIGIDAASGPGIAKAVEEAGKVGDIKVVCVDDTPDIVEAVQKGSIQASVVQKREAFEVWGLRMLYFHNHPGSEITKKYKELGFPMLPNQMLFDVMVMNQDNVGKIKDIIDYMKELE